MKKKQFFFGILLLVAVVVVSFFIFSNRSTKFYFEDELYENSSLKEISISELEALVQEKASFGVFVYQTMCMTSSDFEEVLNKFLDENKVTFYKVSFSELKDSALGEKIKYYPSFLIYKEGELVDFLKADSDEHIAYYRKVDSFKEWLTGYVRLK